jgi:excisionase family DNA binding protein
MEREQETKCGIVEAGSMLGVSPFTLRAWIRERRIPFFRCGRRIVFSRSDLHAFLASNRVEPRKS